MERIGFRMRLLPGARGRVPAPPRGRLAGAARRPHGGGRAQLLDLPRRRGPVRLPRGRRLRGVPDHMAASEANARWQPEMAALIDPLTDPATGFHRRLAEVFHLD